MAFLCLMTSCDSNLFAGSLCHQKCFNLGVNFAEENKFELAHLMRRKCKKQRVLALVLQKCQKAKGTTLCFTEISKSKGSTLWFGSVNV